MGGWIRWLLLAIVAPALGLAVWLGSAPGAVRADFVYASEEPRTLDPHRVSWATEITIANCLFEGLTRLNPQTLRPEPGVASHWETSPDGLAYTFHLRPQARWSNGDPVTAEDFRFAWQRALDPATESQYADLLRVIRGAEEIARRPGLGSWPSDGADGPGVEVLDERTLRVRLARPCPYFLELTSFITLAPLHRPTLERWTGRPGGAASRGRHLWTRPGHIVCNGAFVPVAWEFKRHIRLERNPWYWDGGAIALRSIEVYIATDNAALTAYETGRVDLVRGLGTRAAQRLGELARAGRRGDFHSGDRLATYFFRVNCRRWPLDQADLRIALSLAIDRRAICESVLGTGETPADTYVPRGGLEHMLVRDATGRVHRYQPPAGLCPDCTATQRVALARQHLARSGFAPYAERRPIELLYASDNRDHQRVAEAVQQMWETALGIRVQLRTVEGKVLSTRVRELDYDIVRSDWTGDYLDPSTFLDMFTSDSGQNRTGWSDARYDGLIRRAAAEPDPARRFELLAQAERILCEEQMPIIPLFWRRGSFLLNPRFAGLHDNVLDLLPIHRVRPLEPWATAAP